MSIYPAIPERITQNRLAGGPGWHLLKYLDIRMHEPWQFMVGEEAGSDTLYGVYYEWAGRAAHRGWEGTGLVAFLQAYMAESPGQMSHWLRSYVDDVLDAYKEWGAEATTIPGLGDEAWELAVPFPDGLIQYGVVWRRGKLGGGVYGAADIDSYHAFARRIDATMKFPVLIVGASVAAVVLLGFWWISRRP